MKIICAFSSAIAFAAATPLAAVENKKVKLWFNVEHCSPLSGFINDGFTGMLESLSQKTRRFLVGGALFGDRDTCWHQEVNPVAPREFVSRMKQRKYMGCKGEAVVHQDSPSAIAYASGKLARDDDDIRIVVTVTDDLPAYEPGQYKDGERGSRPLTADPMIAITCNKSYQYTKPEMIAKALKQTKVIPVTITIIPARDAWLKYYKAVGLDVEKGEAAVETFAYSHNDNPYKAGDMTVALQGALFKVLDRLQFFE